MSESRSKCCGEKIIEGFCPHAKEKIYFCFKCKEPTEVEEKEEK